jgi:hypothetical protein
MRISTKPERRGFRADEGGHADIQAAMAVALATAVATAAVPPGAHHE